MKKVIFYSSIILAVCSVAESKAQVRVDVNVGRPVYVVPAPVPVSYYYLPDIEAYYYVPQKIYYYRDRGQWVSNRRLPGYRSYNVYNVRHIQVHEERPYLRHNYYRSRYHAGPGHHGERGHHGPGKWKKPHTHRGRGRH